MERAGCTVPVAHPVEMFTSVFCKRCGETSEPVENCCPWCNAWLVGEPPRVAPVYREAVLEADWHADLPKEERPRKPASMIFPILVVIISYFALIGSLIVMAVLAVVNGVTELDDLYVWMLGVGIFDLILTIFALALVWRLAKQPLPEGTRRLTWLAAWPALLALLCLNIAYISFWREVFRPFGMPEGAQLSLTFLSVIVICLIPAVMEELFFRQLTLGVFRRCMNLHLAVWVTAIMFAFAHIGQFLGMPYLFLAGGVFGYARVYGGLSLAMIMHFIHNFAVIAYEVWK